MASKVKDNNLPFDTRLYGNSIQKYTPNGTWTTTEQNAVAWADWNDSKWMSQKARIRMRNKAPDTPDWYNS